LVLAIDLSVIARRRLVRQPADRMGRDPIGAWVANRHRGIEVQQFPPRTIDALWKPRCMWRFQPDSPWPGWRRARGPSRRPSRPARTCSWRSQGHGRHPAWSIGRTTEIRWGSGQQRLMRMSVALHNGVFRDQSEIVRNPW